VVSRRLSDLPSLGVIGTAMALVAIAYAPFARVPHHLGPEVALSVVGLTFICTTLAFVLFFALIAEVGPSRSTVITYFNPAVAIILGVAVLGEPFTIGLAVGFPLIIAGSVLATRRQSRHGDADVSVAPPANQRKARWGREPGDP
jgi:drug/metabolite transporter (DMT)-like permease